MAVELSDSSSKEGELECNEGEGDPDKGGEMCWNEFIRTESGPELVAKIAMIPEPSDFIPPVSIFVVVGVVGGNEEGGKDDMVRTRHVQASEFMLFRTKYTRYSVTAMPRCPSCGKILPSNDAIQRHMNQPTSRCHRWVDDLVRLSEIEEVEAANLWQGGALDQYYVPEDRNPRDPSWFGGAEGAMDADMDIDPVQGSVEEFPGAAKVFPGERQTFLGAFDDDSFSNE